MKYLKLGLILTAVSLFIFACSQNTTTNTNTTNNSTAVVNSANNSGANTTVPANDELASARKTYSETCVKCHKEDGTGGIKEVDGKKIKVPNFHSDRMMNDKDEDWIDTIKNGAKEDGMPAFKDKLSDDEIKNMVKFIHQDIQGKK